MDTITKKVVGIYNNKTKGTKMDADNKKLNTEPKTQENTTPEQVTIPEPMEGAKVLAAINLGGTYDITLTKVDELEDGKAQMHTAKLAYYRHTTRTHTEDGQIIHRFEAQFNQTLFFIDENGLPVGDFSGFYISKIETSEPVFVKHINIIESKLVAMATEKFGEKAAEIIEFVRDIK